MQRAGERRQPSEQAGRQRCARGCRDAGGEGRARQFVVHQQDHGRPQKLRDMRRLFPPLRKAKVQRLLARLRAERVGELADQALAFHMQDPRHASMRGVARGGQRSEGLECRNASGLGDSGRA